MAAIDNFLQLSMVCIFILLLSYFDDDITSQIKQLDLSFKNAKDLQSRAEMLPKGPSWKCQIIPSLHSTKSPIRLFWRDPVDCLESLFSNPLFHDQLDFIPCRVYKTAVRLLCVYSEWLTGDAAWSIQVCTVVELTRDAISQYCRISCPKAQQSLGLYFHPTKLISRQ
jgi:hypothetical protein